MLVAVEKKELIKGIKLTKRRGISKKTEKREEIKDELALALATVNCTFTYLSHLLAPF